MGPEVLISIYVYDLILTAISVDLQIRKSRPITRGHGPYLDRMRQLAHFLSSLLVDRKINSRGYIDKILLSVNSFQGEIDKNEFKFHFDGLRLLSGLEIFPESQLQIFDAFLFQLKSGKCRSNRYGNKLW